MPAGWSLVIPVKALSRGKTRLAGPGGFPDDVRAELALAFALDTVSAALASAAVAAVVVVTEDPVVAARTGELGARVVAEVATGLNPAIRTGLSACSGELVAALCGDLPALRTDELTAALGLASRGGVTVVADRQATGTTLLAAAERTLLQPLFGALSLQRHVAAGAQALTSRHVPSVRCDVDTAEDLAQAVALGLGHFSRAAVVKLTP